MTHKLALKLSFAGVLIILIAMGLWFYAAPRPTHRIWFAPTDSFELNGHGSVDFMQLFQPDAPWQRTASYVRVFKLYSPFPGQASDADIATVINDLNRRHISLAIEFGMLHASATCGHAVEGYGGEHATAVAERIRRLGGTLQYVAADEPLFFGHYYRRGSACHTSIPDLAQDAASTARAFQVVFPNVQFIDIEPISNYEIPNWVNTIGQWLKAFRQASGQPFAAVHLDIAWWRVGWQQRAQAITSYLRGIGEPIGVIYNGNAKAQSDEEWLNQAREHYQAYEAVVGSLPTDAIFQTWVPHPARILPETSPMAFSNLILDYVRSHPGVGPHS